MSFYIVVFSALFPTLVQCGGPLSRHNWKERLGNTYQKPWAKYKEAFIWSSFGKVSLKNQNVIKLLKVLKIVLQPSTLLRNSSFTKKFEKVETSLLFRVHLLSPKYVLGPLIKIFQGISWILKLCVGIHSVITFDYLRIYGNAKICGSYVQIMHHSKHYQTVFTFCGIYSGFNVYPPSQQVKYLVNSQCLKFFEMTTVFDLNTEHMIDTIFYEPTSTDRKYRPHVIALFATQVISSLHIILGKLKQVVIKTIQEAKSFVVFDGPGFLSEKRRVLNVPFFCSTFQCILQI